jgi:hypothetical protein
MITIMNLRNTKPSEKYDVRIDRGWSALANPFKMNTEAEREQVIKDYEKYFYQKINRKDSYICTDLESLTTIYKTYGKLRLFCWCSPKKCHGEIVREYILNSIGKENKPMDTVPYNETPKEETVAPVAKKGRGRPKGSKNRKGTKANPVVATPPEAV